MTNAPIGQWTGLFFMHQSLLPKLLLQGGCAAGSTLMKVFAGLSSSRSSTIGVKGSLASLKVIASGTVIVALLIPGVH